MFVPFVTLCTEKPRQNSLLITFTAPMFGSGADLIKHLDAYLDIFLYQRE